MKLNGTMGNVACRVSAGTAPRSTPTRRSPTQEDVSDLDMSADGGVPEERPPGQNQAVRALTNALAVVRRNPLQQSLGGASSALALNLEYINYLAGETLPREPERDEYIFEPRGDGSRASSASSEYSLGDSDEDVAERVATETREAAKTHGRPPIKKEARDQVQCSTILEDVRGEDAVTPALAAASAIARGGYLHAAHREPGIGFSANKRQVRGIRIAFNPERRAGVSGTIAARPAWRP